MRMVEQIKRPVINSLSGRSTKSLNRSTSTAVTIITAKIRPTALSMS